MLYEVITIVGTHPEMTYLQTELQNRHDRRLQLALKRRRYEEECVLASRKAEENGIWSWWKVSIFSLTVNTVLTKIIA